MLRIMLRLVAAVTLLGTAAGYKVPGVGRRAAVASGAAAAFTALPAFAAVKSCPSGANNCCALALEFLHTSIF